MNYFNVISILRASLILVTATALSSCGGGSSSSSTSTSTATTNDTSSNLNSSTFLQATGNTPITIPVLSEECKTPLADELVQADFHGEAPILEASRELQIKCSAEMKSVYDYEQSLLTSNRVAARITPIEPLEGLINFESPHVHPIDITPNGNTLVSVNTAAHTLEVWNISGSSISPIATIPVGLDPVSVRARNNNEVWVVNHLSDSVSIVDLNSETVTQTLKTQNEPSDIVFAGSNRAFVSVSEANAINVFNLNELNATYTFVKILGEEPRSLAVSANGDTVYAAIYESGNGTTFSGARGKGGPIIQSNSIMDNDVAIINTTSLEVTYRRRILNMVMAVGVNPSTQEVFAVGTNAANLIAGEPALNGKFITVSTAKFSDAGLNNASITDLNPHLDYTTPTVSNNLRQQSLGDPRSIVWQQNGQRAFITGMGSNNVAVINADGDRIAHFNVGQGPTGIVLKENANIGFVMNKFAGSISVINLSSLSQISEVEFNDPTPSVIKEGRPFIYDTHLTSGTGHTSCASCHVDSRTDRLAWQLSDENNTAINIPAGDNTVPGEVKRTVTIRSNKTSMVTQTLLDIMEHPRFHWRGDKGSIDEFNGTYVNLMGRESEITQTQMNKMKAFLRTLWLPPNPYREIDNSRPSSIILADGTLFGTTRFLDSNTTSALRGGSGRDCLGCHSGQGNATRNFGSTSQIGFGLGNLHLIAPAFAGIYDKIGLSSGLSGFGFFHDGTSTLFRAGRPVNTDHIAEMMTLEGPQGPLVGEEQRQAPHAGVGQQVTINSGSSASQLSRLDNLISIANKSSWAELIAHRKINGKQRGYVLQRNESFITDSENGFTTKTKLLNTVEDDSPVTFTLVATGMSNRLALDSNLDGILNGDEDATDSGNVENNFTPTIDGNIWEWSAAQTVGYDGNDISISNSKADILEAWIDRDDDNIYIAYFNDGPIDIETWWPWQVYIDTDGSLSTGYQGSNGIGAEFLLEGTDLLRYTGSGNNWAWNVVQSNVGLTNGGAEAEFSISRQVIGNPESIQLIFSANNSPFTVDSSTAGLDLLPNSGSFKFNLNTGNNNSGENSESNAISNTLTPTLDGNLSEWSQATSFGPDGNDISATGAEADWLEAWMAHDNDFLYLAYTNDGPINYDTWWPWQAYMDTDNNPDTGFQINGLGADFIIEGDGVARYTGDGENWSWDFIQTTLKTGKAESQVEIRIPRSVFGNINSFKLSISASNVAFTNDFSSSGQDLYQGTQAVMEYNASP